MDTNKYKKLFLTEADEKIVALNKALLELEKNPTSVNIANDAMRAAHTLKSSAAAMNFMGISHLAHAMEDLFSASGGKHKRLEPGAVDLLFEAADMLSSSIKAIKQDKSELNTAKMVEKLNEISNFKFQISKNNNKSEILNLKSEIIEPIEAIKVDVVVLDKLMNLTEELLVEKMRLGEIVRFVESENIQGENLKSKILNLKSINESFNRLFSDLQFNVVQARMVPLGQIFERFPRMVRDLAKEQGKEIIFEMEGQDIELDRTIIDRLGEPLIHLLRNAVDHGIEKSGNITLSAERERDKVFIKVENDGNSIDWKRVVETALSRGMIDKNTRDKYIKDIDNWKSEIEKLFYFGELSTNEKVTEVSGRGVGLSIVKRTIESLGGVVSLKSPIEGGGTRFTLTLPLTLAIIQALLVKVADQTFALPFSQIDHSVRVPLTNIKKAFDQEVAVVEDEDIPMLRLDEIFGLKRKGGVFLSEEEMQEKKRLLKAELMVIAKKENFSSAPNQSKFGTGQVGLVIDEMISEQDIVVKPFKGALKQSKGFAGITLLGDGRPALILDVATLI